NFIGFFINETNVGHPGDQILINKSTVIKAKYEIKTFVISFMNNDLRLQISTLDYGSTPIYSAGTPTRVPTDSSTFSFIGWNQEFTPVSSDVVYHAQFNETLKKFYVYFMTKNNLLQLQQLDYGVTPIYTGNAPTKKSSATHNYEFVGWSPEIGPTTKDINYIAVFDSSTLLGIKDNPFASFGVSVKEHSRYIQINNAKVGSLYTILDVQGCVVKKGLVGSSSFNITIPQSGHYLIKIGSQTRRVNIK
ncbi:MAG: hypothetical protein GX116_07860, partial [Fibrobacter sp.]|nr:hypothetical protein [Fibrobacter sp.]